MWWTSSVLQGDILEEWCVFSCVLYTGSIQNHLLWDDRHHTGSELLCGRSDKWRAETEDFLAAGPQPIRVLLRESYLQKLHVTVSSCLIAFWLKTLNSIHLVFIFHFSSYKGDPQKLPDAININIYMYCLNILLSQGKI